MTDKEIIEKLIDGASLRTYMVPDDAIPSNSPEHIETYNLPHVVIQGDCFFGKTETAHVAYEPGQPPHPAMSFCYTNIGHLFCSYTPNSGAGMYMSKMRYKAHRWVLKEDCRLVWDSDTARSTEPIKTAIESCARFKMALLDVEGIWNIHPVDLPMLYPLSMTFELKTVMDVYPQNFRNMEQIAALHQQRRDFFQTRPASSKEGGLYFETGGFPTFYAIQSDGSYRSYYDIARDSTQKYLRLRVFADKG